MIKENKQESLLAISNLLDKDFVVAKYQRGYKWSIEQVRQLLEDIEDFYTKSKASFYCLQPIIVTENENPKLWEVIDGQQRLTTIYIILKCLNLSTYKLSYNTRERSELFLNSIDKILINEVDVNLQDDQIANKDLNIAWNIYIENQPENNNIDNYHFFKAYYYAKNWLSDENTDSELFKTTLFNSVKVIWHIIEKNDLNAEKVFINFNKGRIPLDQADLIKAEFILAFKKVFFNKEIQKLKMQEFANEWNQIENTLQNDEFWFFISNDISNKKSYNRIDLLFDLINEKPKSNSDKLYSYSKTKYNESSWKNIIELFEIIKEWFDNRKTFHLVGFALAYNIVDLQKLRKEYNSSIDKHAFLNYLKAKIKNHYIKDKDFNGFDSIFYGHKFCFQILNLFNIAIEEKSDASYRFPFHKLKQQNWNIEHIHAQNPKEFKLVKDVNGWLQDMEHLEKSFYETERLDSTLNFPSQKINDLKKTLLKEDEGLTTIQKKLIDEINEELKIYFDTDNISNLCLLDGPTNKGIGNKPFNEKRKEVLEIAKNGINKKGEKVYVPTGTQRVFSKFYNYQDSDIEMTYWGNKDRKKYIEAIEESIKNMLEKTNE
uniref:DUF262 domain-containing protein n=1 Tax=Flavobacterium sp. TaxID=239 RepID=UPI00404ACAEA